MFSSNVFDYINVLGSTADAAATRHDIISNNIANVNTPGYKRKDIRFETELKHAFAHSDKDSVDARVKNLDLEALTPETYTDYAELSYRYDGNNVDIDTENVELASEQLRYQTLTKAASEELTRMSTAMQTP